MTSAEDDLREWTHALYPGHEVTDSGASADLELVLYRGRQRRHDGPRATPVVTPTADGGEELRLNSWRARYEPDHRRYRVEVPPDATAFGTLRTARFAAQTLVPRWALTHGAVALHGACLVREGRAFVFVGPSGAGKSTLVQRFGGEARVLADDVVMIARDAEGLRAFSTPWAGREGHSIAPGDAPLAMIGRLGQTPTTHARPLEHGEALRALIRQTVRAGDAPPEPQALEQLLWIAAHAAVLDVGVSLEAPLWPVVDAALLTLEGGRS